MSVGLLGTLLFIVVTLLIVFGIFAVVMAKVLGGIGKDSKSSTEESQMMQELYEGLTKMETRMEALETILLERESRRDP